MTNWKNEWHTDIKNKVILFLISPFLAFVYSLKRINTKSSYWVFFLFALFFGLSFTNDQGPNEQGSLDSARYIAHFKQYSHQLNDQVLIYKDNDYYFDYTAYLISKITDNYHILFLVFAAVFAFFQLKSLKYLTQEKEFKNNIYGLILCLLFTYIGISNINGVRFWTAAWVTVFCYFKIYRDNDKRFLLLLLVTPYIHLSYWTVIGMTILTILTKRFERIWIVMILISFIFSSVAFSFTTQNANLLPDFLANKLLEYTNESVMENEARTGTGFWWIRIASAYLKQAYILTAVCLLIKNRKTVLSDIRTKGLYLASLVWLSFCNFGMSIPSLGRRYILLSYPMIAYLMLVTFKGSKYKYFIYAMPFIFIHDLLYNIPSIYKQVLDFGFFYSSPFYLIYKYILIQ